MYMLNLYAFRATKPRAMLAAHDAVGPRNDESISYYRTRCGRFVACWGAHAEKARANHVCHLLGRPIDCLGTTRDGNPRHPLYLPRDADLQLFWTPGME
jgi:hypothetical protein